MNEQLKAAFEIEMVSNPAIKALAFKMDRANLELIWSLGYLSGHLRGCQLALEKLETA